MKGLTKKGNPFEEVDDFITSIIKSYPKKNVKISSSGFLDAGKVLFLESDMPQSYEDAYFYIEVRKTKSSEIVVECTVRVDGNLRMTDIYPSRHFQNILNPSPVELEEFEMSQGCKYPLTRSFLTDLLNLDTIWKVSLVRNRYLLQTSS